MPPFLTQEVAGTPLLAWVIFGILVIGMLALDLLLFNRKAHVQGMKEAAFWSVVWVGLALGFNVLVWFWKGKQPALEFTTAYLLEKSLSVDNLFIFLVIFKYFKVPTMFQHRVLFWGILGALIMRAVMIGVGVQMIEHFRPVLFAFAGFLVYCGYKLLFSGADDEDPTKSWAYKLTRKYVPLTDKFSEERFFIMENGKRLATPLFLVLVVVEATDLAFAVDSIPACLAISQDLFVVYTSNIFAILGLRALFFLLAGMMGELRYLKPALAFVLVFIGVKMVLAELAGHYEVSWAFKIPTGVSLGVVGGALALAVIASLLVPGKPHGEPASGEIAVHPPQPEPVGGSEVQVTGPDAKA